MMGLSVLSALISCFEQSDRLSENVVFGMLTDLFLSYSCERGMCDGVCGVCMEHLDLV